MSDLGPWRVSSALLTTKNNFQRQCMPPSASRAGPAQSHESNAWVNSVQPATDSRRGEEKEGVHMLGPADQDGTVCILLINDIMLHASRRLA